MDKNQQAPASNTTDSQDKEAVKTGQEAISMENKVSLSGDSQVKEASEKKDAENWRNEG